MEEVTAATAAANGPDPKGWRGLRQEKQKDTTMATHGRYITWGERIDEAKREVARAEALIKIRPTATERLDMARAVLARLEATMKAKGKRRSHVARSIE